MSVEGSPPWSKGRPEVFRSWEDQGLQQHGSGLRLRFGASLLKSTWAPKSSPSCAAKWLHIPQPGGKVCSLEKFGEERPVGPRLGGLGCQNEDSGLYLVSHWEPWNALGKRMQSSEPSFRKSNPAGLECFWKMERRPRAQSRPS